MSFSTLPFLFYFLPAFLAVYYIVPARFRNAVLALGSLLFYWLGAGTGALLVLVALILVNFAAGRLIEDAHGDEKSVAEVEGLVQEYINKLTAA